MSVLFNKCFICNGFLCYGFNQKQEIIATLPGSYIFIQFLKIGVILTGLFAGVFLLYTNQLLIRQRKKELGLYSIFGLEKKHITRILCYENLLLTAAGLVMGTILGMCLGKMFFLILLKLLHLDSGLTFQFSTAALTQTVVCFSIIGIFILLYNLFSVRKANLLNYCMLTAKEILTVFCCVKSSFWSIVPYGSLCVNFHHTLTN